MIEPGTIIDNGAEVITFHNLHNGGNGMIPHGVVLCHWYNRTFPYVVWLLDTENLTATNGHYFRTLDEAADYFDRWSEVVAS